MVAQGELIGDFRVYGVHPGGGLRAVHTQRAQRVVIEIRDRDDWRRHVMNLLRVASMLEAIDHPGLAKIVGHGGLGDRRRWVACELSDGLALSDILEHRRLSIEETIALLRDAGEALAQAHAAGVVHGALGAHDLVIACGSRSYPLQIGGWCDAPAADTADECDDIRALGAIAYRALTGRYPGSFTPELVPGVPGLLSALIVHMIAGDPDVRPSADQVVAAARELAGEREVRARPPRVRWTPAPIPAAEVAEIVELVQRRRTAG